MPTAYIGSSGNSESKRINEMYIGAPNKNSEQPYYTVKKIYMGAAKTGDEPKLMWERTHTLVNNSKNYTISFINSKNSVLDYINEEDNVITLTAINSEVNSSIFITDGINELKDIYTITSSINGDGRKILYVTITTGNYSGKIYINDK